jgi:hypothetical protein
MHRALTAAATVSGRITFGQQDSGWIDAPAASAMAAEVLPGPVTTLQVTMRVGFCIQSTAVEVTSLGYQTDLALLRLGGAQIEDRGDHLVIRSPHNPGHWWGNFLLLDNVPGPEASQSWLDRFTAAFPGAQHVALGFDRMHGTIADLDWFARQGFTVEAQAVMTASKVHQPARRNTDAVYRRLHSDADWAQSVTLRLRCNEETYEPRAYHRYVAARVQTYRGLVEAGHGGWFGAFIDGRLVSQMGLFLACPDFADSRWSKRTRIIGVARWLSRWSTTPASTACLSWQPASWSSSPTRTTSPSTYTAPPGSPRPKRSFRSDADLPATDRTTD